MSAAADSVVLGRRPDQHIPAAPALAPTLAALVPDLRAADTPSGIVDCEACSVPTPQKQGLADAPADAPEPIDMGIVSIEAEWLAVIRGQVAELLDHDDQRCRSRARCLAEVAERLARSLQERAGRLS